MSNALVINVCLQKPCVLCRSGVKYCVRGGLGETFVLRLKGFNALFMPDGWMRLCSSLQSHRTGLCASMYGSTCGPISARDGEW